MGTRASGDLHTNAMQERHKRMRTLLGRCG